MKKKLIILDLSFVEPEYRETWETWMDYKRQIGNCYKTQMGVERAYRDMKKKANNNPQRAMMLVDNAIAREWKGIYQVKELTNGKPNNENKGPISTAFDCLLETMY